MFGFVLTSAVTLMQIYVFWRAGSVPMVKHHVPLKVLLMTGLVLWSVFVMGRFFGHQGTGAILRMLELLGMTWMGVVFLSFISLLAVDFLTGFGFLVPQVVPSLRGLALVAGGVLSAIALFQGLRPPVIEDYAVYMDGLPHEMDGTVLVALSDLHLGSQLGKEWLEARLTEVQAQRPDLVVLLGDLLEGHGLDQSELMPALQRLSAPLGVWVVPGNHEFHGSHNASTTLIERVGFPLLRNRSVRVRPGFVLAGVDDLTARYRSGQTGDDLSKVLASRPPGATILLSHTPWQFHEAARNGAGLMLCGHTHGGQIWPFGYLVKRVYPLLEGRYEVEGMTVIVCRGTGTWGPRMRLWSPGQILRVTLFGKDP